MGAGYRTEKACAGQCIPNKAEARECGVDGSFSINTIETQFNDGKHLFLEVFGEQIWQKMLADIGEIPTLEAFITGFFVAHEAGHLAGQRDPSNRGGETLVAPYIEEFKASLSVIPRLFIPYQQGLVRFKELQTLIMFLLFELCRTATTRHLTFGSFYFRENMLFTKILESVDLISKNDSNWLIDLGNQKKVIRFFETLNANFKHLMLIFERGTATDLRGYLTEHLSSTPILEFVCKKISVPNSEKFTPEKLATLPPESTRLQIKDNLVST